MVVCVCVSLVVCSYVCLCKFVCFFVFFFASFFVTVGCNIIKKKCSPEAAVSAARGNTLYQNGANNLTFSSNFKALGQLFEVILESRGSSGSARGAPEASWDRVCDPNRFSIDF